MAKGARGGKRGGGGFRQITELTAPDGSKIDLSEYPLKTGAKDATLTGDARKALEAFENRRYKNKIEYSYFIDADGNLIGKENKGGKGSVKASYEARMTATAMSHNHPRSGNETGTIGGTFSEADIRNFVRYNQKTYRATALEGTYSISKGQKFDGAGLNRYFQSENAKIRSAARKKADKAYSAYKSVANQFFSGKATYEEAKAAEKKYTQDIKKINNETFVGFHNVLLNGQKK